MWLMQVVVGVGLVLLWAIAMIGKQPTPISWLYGWTGMLSFAYGMHLRSKPGVRHAGLRTMLFGFAVLAISAASFGIRQPVWLSSLGLVGAVLLLSTAVIYGMEWFDKPTRVA
jgi:hypothetical protein